MQSFMFSSKKIISNLRWIGVFFGISCRLTGVCSESFSHTFAPDSVNSASIASVAPGISSSDTDSLGIKGYDLQEVVVTAKNVIRKGNRIELYPDKRDRRFAAGGADVLHNMNIPEISINPQNGSVTYADGEAVSMFIDFQPASAQQVADLRPQDIERIDIIRSPEDPRFQGARVVANYIMKKYVYGGYSKVNATQFVPLFSSQLGLYSKFSYKKLTYDVSAGLGFINLGDHSGNYSKADYNFGDYELIRESCTLSNRQRTLIPRVTARAIYSAPGISISNMVAFNYSRLKPYNSTNAVDFSSIFDSTTSHQEQSKYNRGVVWNTNMYFQLRRGWSLNANAGVSWGHNTDNTSYTLSGYEPILNLISENAIETYATLNFGKRFGSHSLSLAGNGGWNRNKLNYITPIDNPVFHREGFGGLRAMMNLNFNKFSVRPSVSLYLSSERVNELLMTRWRPKAFVPFYIQLSNQSSFSGKFEFAVNSPTTSFFSPIIVRSNEVDAIRGNEFLKDSPNYFTNLAYSNNFASWLSLWIGADYHRENRTVIPIFTPDFSSTGAPLMIRDVRNDGSKGETTFTTRLSGRYFQNRLSVSLSGSAVYFSQRGETRRVKWAPSAWASASWYIGDFLFSAYFSPKRKYYSVWGDGMIPVFWYVGVGYSYRDLYVDLRFNNPFRKSYLSSVQTMTTPDYAYIRNVYSPGDHQNIRLTLTYSIGYGKKLNRHDEVGKMEGAQSIILK